MVKLLWPSPPSPKPAKEWSVLGKDAGVDRARHATQRIDVARVHAGRVAVTVLGFPGKLDALDRHRVLK